MLHRKAPSIESVQQLVFVNITLVAVISCISHTVGTIFDIWEGVYWSVCDLMNEVT